MGLCLCTHVFDDDRQMSRKRNLQRDMLVVKNRIQAKKLPVVWMNNNGDTLKVVTNNLSSHSHACNIAERFGYACISLDRILKEEAEMDTQRGKLVKNKLKQKKKFSDRLILDLIKEKFVEAGETRGYLVNGFPLTAKQSNLFVKEIANVDCIIVLENNEDLSSTIHVPTENDSRSSIDSKQLPKYLAGIGINSPAKKQKDNDMNMERESGDKKSETIKSEELYKDLCSACNFKYDLLIEKINTNEPAADVFLKIEAAIMDRLSISNI